MRLVLSFLAQKGGRENEMGFQCTASSVPTARLPAKLGAFIIVKLTTESNIGKDVWTCRDNSLTGISLTLSSPSLMQKHHRLRERKTLFHILQLKGESGSARQSPDFFSPCSSFQVYFQILSQNHCGLMRGSFLFPATICLVPVLRVCYKDEEGRSPLP